MTILLSEKRREPRREALKRLPCRRKWPISRQVMDCRECNYYLCKTRAQWTRAQNHRPSTPDSAVVDINRSHVGSFRRVVIQAWDSKGPQTSHHAI